MPNERKAIDISSPKNLNKSLFSAQNDNIENATHDQSLNLELLSSSDEEEDQKENSFGKNLTLDKVNRNVSSDNVSGDLTKKSTELSNHTDNKDLNKSVEQCHEIPCFTG